MGGDNIKNKPEKRNEYNMRLWTGTIWFKIGTVASFFDHGNEPSSFIKYAKFLECLKNCQLLNIDSFSWEVL